MIIIRYKMTKNWMVHKISRKLSGKNWPILIINGTFIIIQRSGSKKALSGGNSCPSITNKKYILDFPLTTFDNFKLKLHTKQWNWRAMFFKWQISQLLLKFENFQCCKIIKALAEIHVLLWQHLKVLACYKSCSMDDVFKRLGF